MFPSERWWEDFRDPVLSSLIEEGFAASPDVAKARARILLADALVGQTNAGLLPQLSGDGKVIGEKLSRNDIFPENFVPKGVLTQGTLTSSIALDLDLWGKRRAELAAATSEAQATRLDLQQARLALSSAIALSYFDLVRLLYEQRVLTDKLAIAGRNEQLVGARVRQGIEMQGASRQAEAQTAAVRSEKLAVDNGVLVARHALAALLGAGPDRTLDIRTPSVVDPLPLGVPDNLGADLLGRRADLVAARLRVEAGRQQVKSAKAAFLPNINLSAIGGFQAVGLSQLLDRGSLIANFGPAIHLPIFDGGALRAGYRRARGSADMAVADYNGTLVRALQEAADAIGQKRLAADRVATAKRAMDSTAENARLVGLRYRQGIANEMDHLTARSAAVDAQKRYIDARALDISYDIALRRALGGGFATSAPPVTASSNGTAP